LERENRDLRAENARLTDKLSDARHMISELKRDLSVKVTADTMATLHAHFRMTPGDAWILAALYMARGKVVTSKSLLDEMPGLRPDDRDPKILTVRIAMARKAVGREGIKTSFGVGYALTASGIAACDAAFSKQGKA
jgi:DNA-binding response OmpR family regulator